MRNPVIALGLDAAEPELLERWMEEGFLPNFSALRRQGAYGRLYNRVEYAGGEVDYSHTEPLWVMFNTGCLPSTTGYWDIVKYDPDSYGIDSAVEKRPFDYAAQPAFFELGDDYRVATFDLPDWLPSPRVNGPQVMGWGGHFSSGHSHSWPADFLGEINDKHGRCGVIRRDHGAFWDADYLRRLTAELKSSAAKRSRIYRDLLRRERWDLFLGLFSETHSAGHSFWFLSQPDHPLYSQKQKLGITGDPLRETFIAIDTALGEILEDVPPDSAVVCFTVHGMDENQTDLLSMLMLPELLYRYNFPGKVGVGAADAAGAPGPQIIKSLRRSWSGEVWSRKHETGGLRRLLRRWSPTRFSATAAGSDLLSPAEGGQAVLPWMPASWYRRVWPRMRAFAIPAFSMGQIRINLVGRDSNGVVARDDYDSVCDEIAAFLMEVKDARSGRPVVDKVVRTRRTPADNDPNLPDPDLLVVWHGRAVDVVDSPQVGRVGPVPFARSGSHRNRGFVMARGADIVPGTALPQGSAIDLGPTILRLMGAEAPAPMDGSSLI